MTAEGRRRRPGPDGFAAILAMLTATGWAANHFAAMIPVLRTDRALSDAVLTGVFGIYAVGLLPGLFGGGALSDRVGRRAVAVPGATIAALGTVLLAAWHDPTGLLLGRLVVGLGAGLAIGTGTAWAADLRGPAGAARAGVALTSGFACGPVVSGLLAPIVPAPAVTPFMVSALVSAATIATVVARTRPVEHAHRATATAGASRGSARRALTWSLPLALWVFSCATFAFVVLAARLPGTVQGPVTTGLAAGVTLGTGIVVQVVARTRGWGRAVGVVGPALAAVGFVIAALAGHGLGIPVLGLCCVVLGAAYGLCLREGLLDVEAWAPAHRRGTLTGVFYVGAYTGFALPYALVELEPVTGIAAPVLVLAAIAAFVAVVRAIRLRVGRGRRTLVGVTAGSGDPDGHQRDGRRPDPL